MIKPDRSILALMVGQLVAAIYQIIDKSDLTSYEKIQLVTDIDLGKITDSFAWPNEFFKIQQDMVSNLDLKYGTFICPIKEYYKNYPSCIYFIEWLDYARSLEKIILLQSGIYCYEISFEALADILWTNMKEYRVLGYANES